MIREEAKQVRLRCPDDKARWIIFVDNLYDSFESRTCGNCKHGKYEENIKAIYCPFINYLGSDYMETDFGCNRFESTAKG